MGTIHNLKASPSRIVVNAIKDLKPKEGLSFREILSYAVRKYGVRQGDYKIPLGHALKRGLKYKILNYSNGMYNLNTDAKNHEAASSFWKKLSIFGKKKTQKKKSQRRVQKNVKDADLAEKKEKAKDGTKSKEECSCKRYRRQRRTRAGKKSTKVKPPSPTKSQVSSVDQKRPE